MSIENILRNFYVCVCFNTMQVNGHQNCSVQLKYAHFSCVEISPLFLLLHQHLLYVTVLVYKTEIFGASQAALLIPKNLGEEHFHSVPIPWPSGCKQKECIVGGRAVLAYSGGQLVTDCLFFFRTTARHSQGEVTFSTPYWALRSLRFRFIFLSTVLHVSQPPYWHQVQSTCRDALIFSCFHKHWMNWYLIQRYKRIKMEDRQKYFVWVNDNDHDD